ncbi:riboflavin biosynthesis protein [Bacteroidia bacterium]|nr:riboflavin biosynthesis protein [Bacteroidia bacterium]
MQVIKDLSNLPVIENPVVTTGVFDGVHRAHKQVLQQLRRLAVNSNGQSVVITFDEHPAKTIAPNRWGIDLFLLTDLDEKMELIEAENVDYLIILPFDKDFAMISYEEYVCDYLVKQLHVSQILVGYDHNFGYEGLGNFEKLQALGLQYQFKTELFPEYLFENGTISSTSIRNAILAGEIEHANQKLGYDYRLFGTIKKNHLIVRHDNKLIPAYGSYKVVVTVGDCERDSVCTVGKEIVFSDTLFDDVDDTVKVSFYQYLD